MRKIVCALCLFTTAVITGATDSKEYNDDFSTKKWSDWKSKTAKGKFHRLIFDLLQIVNLESK